MQTRARQDGWAGLIGLIIVVAIVLFLGRTLLQQMGVLSPHPTAASTPVSRQLAPTDEATGSQAASSTPSYRAPIERARSVESTILQQARDTDARVERSSQ
jgi:hypothetical protein